MNSKGLIPSDHVPTTYRDSWDRPSVRHTHRLTFLCLTYESKVGMLWELILWYQVGSNILKSWWYLFFYSTISTYGTEDSEAAILPELTGAAHPPWSVSVSPKTLHKKKNAYMHKKKHNKILKFCNIKHIWLYACWWDFVIFLRVKCGLKQSRRTSKLNRLK